MKDALIILDQITAIEKRMEEAETKSAKLLSETVSKRTLRVRIAQMISIAVIAVTLGMVAEHVTITKCFLSPSQTGWNKNVCSLMFPGYDKARQQNEKNIRQFQDLIKQVPDLNTRVTELEQQTK